MLYRIFRSNLIFGLFLIENVFGLAFFESLRVLFPILGYIFFGFTHLKLMFGLMLSGTAFSVCHWLSKLGKGEFKIKMWIWFACWKLSILIGVFNKTERLLLVVTHFTPVYISQKVSKSQVLYVHCVCYTLLYRHAVYMHFAFLCLHKRLKALSRQILTSFRIELCCRNTRRSLFHKSAITVIIPICISEHWTLLCHCVKNMAHLGTYPWTEKKTS